MLGGISGALSAQPPFVVRFSMDFVRDRNERQVRAHFAECYNSDMLSSIKAKVVYNKLADCMKSLEHWETFNAT